MKLLLLIVVWSSILALCQCQSFNVSSLLTVPGWQAEHICNTTAAECCCFTNTVNFYTSATGELNINGTVAGGKCKRAVEADNLDVGTSYSFTAEFFGIDDYAFLVSNTTFNGVFGYKLAATSIEHPRCNFSLFHASASGIPSPVTPTATPPPVLPTFVVPFVSNSWDFNTPTTQTCAASSSCCCLSGITRIYPDPAGAQSLFVTGTPSAGCALPLNQSETDDFPWPTQGTATSVTGPANGFLVNQDDYVVTLTLTNNLYQLSFQDTTTPGCSMLATRLASSTSPTPSLGGASVRAAAAALHIPLCVIAIMMIMLLGK